VLREGLDEQHPGIQDVIDPVSEKLTNDVLLDLNAEVDVKGREPVDVAEEWLRDEGFIR
jgi:osmoprotectant transport system substrate-binding protein